MARCSFRIQDGSLKVDNEDYREKLGVCVLDSNGLEGPRSFRAETSE